MRRNIKKLLSVLTDDLPQHVKAMRVGAGMSQKDLADKLPTAKSQQTISNWESGATQIGMIDFMLVCLICGRDPKTFIPEALDSNNAQDKKELGND